MINFKAIANFNDIPDHGMKMVIVDGQEILLAHIGEKVYAANNRCPHMGGNLSQGKLEGTIITCPRHGSQFDLIDGHNVRWTNWTGIKLAGAKILRYPRPLKTWEVKIENGKVMVGFN